jgi:molybdenum cofactor synthesis domain-containing protein
MADGKNKKLAVSGVKTIPVEKAVGMVLAHDITEIRLAPAQGSTVDIPVAVNKGDGKFKGRAFKKGHVVREEDISHLKRLGKDNIFVLDIGNDEMHEDDAAHLLARSLAGDGVVFEGEPKEGKINLLAGKDGILKVDREALFRFNQLGEVMCATLHSNTLVSKGQMIGGTRAIPLIVKKATVERAVHVAQSSRNNGYSGTIEVKELRRPRAGIVITGNEVYYGRIKDAFAPIIKAKIERFGGDIVAIHYAPDDAAFIEGKLRELIKDGADLLITTGGMSVDPDDVTRFAVRNLGVSELHYGSSVLPGAMFMIAYLEKGLIPGSKSPIPILGIPACGMYHKITIFDLVLPRVLSGEHIGRDELAAMGHGGLCMNCKVCNYPVCPFGKG